MTDPRYARWWWIAAGVLVLFSAGATSLLSDRFVFGEGHAERPIGWFITLYLVGWLGFCLAFVLAIRHGRGSLYWIVGVGLLARTLLLPSSLIQESDCYRYVLDGEALLHGVNPYAFAPEDLLSDAPEHFREALEQPDPLKVLSRVSYQHVPTIYPPLAQLSFAAGALVAPWDWQGQRWVFLAYDVLTLLALVALLRTLGKPPAWAAVYAWNPLILKEIANSAHSDSLAGLCLVLLIWCLVRSRHSGTGVWSALAGLALAGAVLARLYPVMLFPVCLVYLARGPSPGRALVLFIGASVAAVCAFSLPFLGVGFDQMTAGLRAYGDEWQRNDGLFSLIAWLFPQPRVVAASLVASLACFSAIRLYRGVATYDRLVAVVQAVLLGWLLVTPAVYPWYAVGLLAVSTLRPRFWVVILSGAFVMYYLLFLYSYRDYPALWTVWTRAIEHLLFWFALAATPFLRLLQPGCRPKQPEIDETETDPAGA